MTSTFALPADRLDVVAAAEAAGVSRSTVLETIERLDAAVAAVTGNGFEPTPFGPQSRLANALDLTGAELWVKDETGNVSGSHKGRHLFGVALGFALAGETPDRLAIASCGNAAFAASVIAAATEQPLEVFVPDWADESITERIASHGATVVRAPRDPDRLGDPAHHAMVEAIADGATAFSVQGTETPTTVDGGRTIAYEMLDTLRDHRIDRLLIQVGGGALGSAVTSGLQRVLGDDGLPVIHAVQAEGNHPLAVAWDRIVTELGETDPRTNLDRARAAEAIGKMPVDARRAVLGRVAADADAYMRPWPREPRSYATGILDDITYDWLPLVDAMLASGGHPIVAGDMDFRMAHMLAHAHTDIPVCPTGAAGLGGLLTLQRDVRPDLAGERIAVVFSGHQRDGDPRPN
ncbi:MAG: pyridoxal-phosphate dependent enzyme [Actinomycetota bacterium]